MSEGTMRQASGVMVMFLDLDASYPGILVCGNSVSCKCIHVLACIIIFQLKVKIANISYSLPCAWHCSGSFTLLPRYPQGYNSRRTPNPTVRRIVALL